jgi:3-hydroxyacyl-[acyl-carrier protein] dehydratase/trans-2-decenoyl-[acyl-carrier protein] isomerase
VLGIADGRMYSDNNLIYKADDLRVGLFVPENSEKEVL